MPQNSSILDRISNTFSPRFDWLELFQALAAVTLLMQVFANEISTWWYRPRGEGQSVFKYIETFYNRERIYQTLDYKTPDQYEAEYASAIAA